MYFRNEKNYYSNLNVVLVINFIHLSSDGFKVV